MISKDYMHCTLLTRYCKRLQGCDWGLIKKDENSLNIKLVDIRAAATAKRGTVAGYFRHRSVNSYSKCTCTYNIPKWPNCELNWLSIDWAFFFHGNFTYLQIIIKASN